MTLSIRLVVADRHPIVLTGLKHLFFDQSDFIVKASCLDQVAVLKAVEEFAPDILLIDSDICVSDIGVFIRQVQAFSENTRLVLYLSQLNEKRMLELTRLGVKGILLKEMPTHLLLQCLRSVASGQEWIEKRSVRKALESMLQREAFNQGLDFNLTARELELMHLVAAGRSNAEIASELCISLGTAKIHLHNVYQKLQIKTRVALTNFMRENGFF